jgi:hypothetical protein
MKQVFSSNKKLNRIRSFGAGSILLNFLLLFILSLQIENVSSCLIISISTIIFIVILIALYQSNNNPTRIEIENYSFTFYFPFSKPKNYKFDDVVCYATSCDGNYRVAFYHAVVLEFSDNYRTLVSDLRIENYQEFLEFIRRSKFEYFGYIGQKIWRRKSKPLSKKWVVKREEAELEKKIGKETGKFYFYSMTAMSILMNMVMLYVLFFQH